MKRGIASLALATVGAAVCLAQSITVVVNGEPVRFPGVGAQQLNGRVLVPLRGVMERLGAYVGYEPNGRIVTATRGDVDLELRLGQRIARVNGREVQLDVPAMEFRGSTMVPLRFMSEALGADVRWDAATYSVMITTAGSSGNANQPIVTPPTNPPPASLAITSFDVDAPGSLRAGSTISFTLVGTPGGNASVQIPGVTGEIALSETSSGRYTGTYTVPTSNTKPITVSRASAIAKLRIGNAERLIQSGTALVVDSEAPRITSTTPEENGRINRSRPNITAVFDDASGTGVDPTTVSITVDGREVTQDATVTSNLVVYKPDADLAAGRHTVSITGRDRAGNPVTKQWSFQVETAASVVKSFTMTGPDNPQPGDEVTFVLIGEPGGQATFSIGDRVRTRVMREIQPGRYEANYTIRRGDQFQNTVVTARLKSASGEVYTAEANRTLGIRTAGVLEVPKLAEPKQGDLVGNDLTIRGTAAPGARVQIRIDYTQSVLGAFKMNGTVAEMVVDADNNGRFVTKPVNLDTGLGRSGVTYTITAVTLGPNDQKSEASKLTFKR
jgi:hypothetical protein